MKSQRADKNESADVKNTIATLTPYGDTQQVIGFKKTANVLSRFYREEEIGHIHMFILQDFN